MLPPPPPGLFLSDDPMQTITGYVLESQNNILPVLVSKTKGNGKLSSGLHIKISMPGTTLSNQDIRT